MTVLKKIPPAMEFFKAAMAYQHSADMLNGLLADQPRVGLPLSDPVYFLYHHTIELALKAYLLCNGLSIPKGRERHNILALFDRCRTRGLVDLHDENETQKLISYLSTEDHGIGYRYARPSDLVPDLNWVQEVVRNLIAAIKPELENWAERSGVSGLSVPYTITRLRYSIRPHRSRTVNA